MRSWSRQEAGKQSRKQQQRKIFLSIMAKMYIAYFAVFLLALFNYLPSLWGDFVFDDAEAILNNDDVITNSSLTQVFSNDFWGTPIASRKSHKSYRPLTVITYRLNYWIASGHNPMVYHLTNLLLHPMVALMYTLVCRIVINEVWCCSKSSGRGLESIASVAGIIFAVHPIHTECVSVLICML